MNRNQQAVKRAFDVFFSLCGSILLSIPLCFLILLLKSVSHGPVFFRQNRVGRNGEMFVCIKFRTMSVNSESLGTVTSATDSRITHCGRFLRKYKIDELPQLWNILLGKMSFVGPRPDVPGYADTLAGNARQILELRPGITGPASLYFRNEEEILASVENPRLFNDTVIWPKKVALNLDYYDHWSFWKDIGYILVTLFPRFDRFLKLIPKLDT
jgi:lipopolysaccharide/colanic/teichoic acid biosynthesis glycosyltransferase